MARQTRREYKKQNATCIEQRFLESETSYLDSPLNSFESLWKVIIQEYRNLKIENQFLRKRYTQLLQENQRLIHEVNYDSLTGLYSRRYLDTYIEQQCKAASLSGHELSLLMIDIDHFKQYNDTYGHQAGDQLLQKIGTILSTVIQQSNNCIARYGGEEFVAVLPSHTQTKALDVAKNIQTVISNIGVTVSIGIAIYGEDGKTPLDLLQCADHRLYAAKGNGRNRIEMSGL